MADKTKQALRVENNQSFPNNNSGFITPDKLRTFHENIIDSFVNNEDSGSTGQIDTGSFATTGSNTFTGEQTIQKNEGLTILNDGGTGDVTLTPGPDFVTKFTAAQLTGRVQLLSGSINDDGGYIRYNVSQPRRWEIIANTNATTGIRLQKVGGALLDINDNINIFGDVNLYKESSSVTASLFTGSFVGDGSGLTGIPTTDITQLNQFTESADNRLTNIELETASLDGRVSSIENETASLETKFDTLATTTSSLQDFTASADSRLTNIESNTGSYARTDTTNQFQETQTLEQDLVVQGNLYVSGAEVIISSSELIVGDRIIEVNANKVIGDAGLYAFDAIGDQTGSFIWNPNLDYWLAGLSGSEEKVLVSSDTASIETSLNSLNNLSGSLLQTASNDFSEITLTKVDGSTQVLDTTPRQVVESVKNGNGQQLPKGTPVYASGSVGNAQLVFPASASDDTTMPAVYILAQTLDPDEEGLGYTHGFINGVNTSLFNAGDEIYVGVNGGYTNQAPTGSTNLIQKLGTVVRSDVSNGSGVIQIDSIRALPNIQEGYAWVGDSDGVPQPFSTSSWDAQSDLSSLNAFTQSAEGRLDNIEITTASLESRTTNIENFTSSQEEKNTTLENVTSSLQLFTSSVDDKFNTIGIVTGALETFTSSQEDLNVTFATTGSNTFTGTQTIVGDLDTQGTFTASLTEGYVWVGDGTGTSVEVSTGSFGGGSTDISSLNAFTESADIRLDNLETYTSSQDTTNTELLNASSSFAAKFDTIETQSGSWGGGASSLTIFKTGLCNISPINPTSFVTQSIFSDSSSLEINPDTWSFNDNSITIPTTGTYVVNFQANVSWPSGDGRQYPVIYFITNGVEHPVYTSTYIREDGVDYPLALHTMMQFTAGDTFQIKSTFQQSPGGTSRADVNLIGADSEISFHQIR